MKSQISGLSRTSGNAEKSKVKNTNVIETYNNTKNTGAAKISMPDSVTSLKMYQ